MLQNWTELSEEGIMNEVIHGCEIQSSRSITLSNSEKCPDDSAWNLKDELDTQFLQKFWERSATQAMPRVSLNFR